MAGKDANMWAITINGVERGKKRKTMAFPFKVVYPVHMLPDCLGGRVASF